MIHQFLKVVFIACCALILTPNKTVNAQSYTNIVVGEVGDVKITFQELFERYQTGTSEFPTLDELSTFLGIYIEYQLKLQFAYERGYDNDPELKTEFDQYAKQAAFSFLVEQKIKPSEFNKYYERALKEIKSSHILIEIDKNDTLAAYNQITEARNEWLSGNKTFEELNETYSSKKNGRLMGGKLPWVSIGTTVAEFEDQLYSLEAGELSQPFKTQFGYHVLRVDEIRPRTSPRMVSHIFQPNTNKADSILNKAYIELKSTGNWNNAVKQYSADKPSVANNGYIGWVQHGKFRPDFVEQVSQIDPTLPFTKPIQTAYGYHIFKVDSVQTFTSEEHRKSILMQEFLDSKNFSKSNAFVAQWLIDNDYAKVNTELINELSNYIKSFGSNTLKDLPNNAFTSKIVFTFIDNEYKASDLRNHLIAEYSSIQGQNFNDKILQNFYTKLVSNHIIEFTRSMFDAFNQDLNNYREGLIVYKVNDEELWSAATVDTSKLVDIYQRNKKDYSYPTRYHYTLINAVNDSTLHEATKALSNGVSIDSLRSLVPEIAITTDSTSYISEEPLTKLTEMKIGETSDKFLYRKRPSLLILHDILQPRTMTFKEAFSRLLSEYQPERERNWLIKTEKQFPVKTYTKNLERAYNEYIKDHS